MVTQVPTRNGIGTCKAHPRLERSTSTAAKVRSRSDSPVTLTSTGCDTAMRAPARPRVSRAGRRVRDCARPHRRGSDPGHALGCRPRSAAPGGVVAELGDQAPALKRPQPPLLLGIDPQGPPRLPPQDETDDAVV